MEGLPRSAWLFPALLILVSSYGWTINDEADQSAALYNLAHGSLRVRQVPSSSYAIEDEVVQTRRWDDTPVASTFLNVVALPVAALLLVATAVVPVPLFVGGVALAFAWRGFSLARPWGSGTRLEQAVRWATFVAGLAFLTWGFDIDGPDVHFYWATIALQATNVLLALLAARLLWDIATPLVSDPGTRLLAVGAVTLGSFLFWAQALKYHMLGFLITTLVLWLLIRPRSRVRDLALGAACGLAFWVNPIVGIPALLATTVAWAFASRGRAGPLVAVGLALGLAPAMGESWILYGSPFETFYTTGAIAPDRPASAEPYTASIAVPLALGQDYVEGVLGWQGVRHFAANLASTWTTGHRLDGDSLGILVITPVLALAARGAWLQARASPAAPWAIWSLSLLIAQAVLFTNAGVVQGAGPDARLWFHVLPAAATLAFAGIPKGLTLPARRVLGHALVAVALVLALGALVMASGLRFGDGATQNARNLHLFAVCLAAAALVAWSAIAWARPDAKFRLAHAGAVIAVASPILWTVAFVLLDPTRLPRLGQHEGGGMVIPVMERIVVALREHLPHAF